MPIDINLLRTDAGKYRNIFTTEILSPLFYIGSDPSVVKLSEERRFRDPKLIDEIIEIDEQWRKCMI